MGWEDFPKKKKLKILKWVGPTHLALWTFLYGGLVGPMDFFGPNPSELRAMWALAVPFGISSFGQLHIRKIVNVSISFKTLNI